MTKQPLSIYSTPTIDPGISRVQVYDHGKVVFETKESEGLEKAATWVEEHYDTLPASQPEQAQVSPVDVPDFVEHLADYLASQKDLQEAHDDDVRQILNGTMDNPNPFPGLDHLIPSPHVDADGSPVRKPVAMFGEFFTVRDENLIQNCLDYAAGTPAGLPGHALMLLLAKLARCYSVQQDLSTYTWLQDGESPNDD